eukprot:scaffold2228_cov288-Pinguiococcus_pyrenoidosus.AAC.2
MVSSPRVSLAIRADLQRGTLRTLDESSISALVQRTALWSRCREGRILLLCDRRLQTLESSLQRLILL